MHFRAVATDLEFVKTGGQVLARSAAFVPFVARSPLSLCVLSGHAPSPSDGLAEGSATNSTGHHPLPSCYFPAGASVLSLSVEEVLRVADVLPCGHVLLPHLQQTLLSGEPLEQLKATYASEAAEAWDAFRALQKDLHAKARATRGSSQAQCVDTGAGRLDAEELNDEEDHTRDEASSMTTATSSSSSEPLTKVGRPTLSHHTKSTGALSPQEVALRRQFQMRAAIPRFYEVLDPFGIPNISRLDVALCRALYTEDVSSPAFLHASQGLSHLRAYGRGKGRHKALAFLFRYYPEFAQQILRRSFAHCEDWLRFLRDCRDISQRELERVQLSHHSGQTPLRLPSAAAATRQVTFVESPSLAAFSQTLNHTWSSYLYGAASRGQSPSSPRGGGSKFFAYGNSDAAVLHASLQSSCHAYQTHHLSARAMKAGRVDDRSSADASTPAGRPRGKDRFRSRKVASPSTRADASHTVLSSVPNDILVSPFQAKLRDVTQHSLFKAAGFCSSSNKVPPLTHALASLVEKDATAAAVHELQEPHDPLWDAQALACVCVGCGVVR